MSSGVETVKKGSYHFLTVKAVESISRKTSRLLNKKQKKLRDLIKRAQSSISICGCQVTGGNRDRTERAGANSDNLEELDMNTSKAHSHNWKFIIETL